MVFTHDSLPGKQFLFIPVAFVETGSCLLYPVSLHFLVFSRSFARQGSIFCVCRPQHAGHVSSLRWGSDSAVSPASLVWDRALLLPARLGHPFLSSWVNTGAATITSRLGDTPGGGCSAREESMWESQHGSRRILGELRKGPAWIQKDPRPGST